jgi:hypothetical protein
MTDSQKKPAPMTIQERVRLYRSKWIEAGQWQDPNLTDCLDFMATEVAEAIDSRLRMTAGYMRNTSQPTPTTVDIGIEVFDAIMMGCIALDLLGLDLDEIAAMKLQRMDEKKGVQVEDGDAPSPLGERGCDVPIAG